MTGHLLTAAAAMEALACIVALERQTLPPTINLDDPDPECPLRHVPNQAEAAQGAHRRLELVRLRRQQYVPDSGGRIVLASRER